MLNNDDDKVDELAQWTVDVDDLVKYCDPAIFEFTGTDELSPHSDTIGQTQAVLSIQFGLEIDSPGYNIFAMGSTGTGRRTTVQRIVGTQAAGKDTPDDWVYVHNFGIPGNPQALRLPHKIGSEFRGDMDRFSSGLAERLTQAFDAEQYAAVRRPLEQALQMHNQQELSGVALACQVAGFSLVNSPSGLYIAPVQDGEILTPAVQNGLPQEQQLALEQERQRLDDLLTTVLRRIRDAERKTTMAIEELDREVADYSIQPMMAELHTKYADIPQITSYLNAVRTDVINHVELLRDQGQSAEYPEGSTSLDISLPHRYRVNLLVDNSKVAGAPVITLDAPTYQKLFGYIEYDVRQGITVTNHILIRAGALHQANGGYLILDAESLLESPDLWVSLKRTLFTRVLSVESIDGHGLVRTITPTPEAIPLDVKIILHGVPYIYYGLYEMDDDFAKLFKVQADFHSIMDRTAQTEMTYAQFIHNLCTDEKLLPFCPEAVARVVEFGVRLAGHQRRISTRFGDIADLIREASFWARKANHPRVLREDVVQSIQQSRNRSSLSEELTIKEILENTIRLTTTGSEVGEINALMIQTLGGFRYGMPSRVTAQVYQGRGNVVSIQREAELSGPIYDKGVLTLSGYIGGQYGKDQQLSMEASISMEQVYDGIDGDSASSAELYALISAASGLPLRQDIAVTGAVDQYGRILAIGGVNEKIEGFYKICEERELTGTQGVLIPEDNIKHLMLNEDVVTAVCAGLFHIYAVGTVDEGLLILTGHAAGTPDESGDFPEGSVHAAVMENLKDYSQDNKSQES